MKFSKKHLAVFENKNILITGGAGFIGSNLIRFFQKNCPKSNLFIFDRFRDDSRFSNGNLISFGHFNNIINFDGEVIWGDLKNPNDLEKLRKYKFDYIFHQAAISDTTVYDQSIVMRTNLESFKTFLDFAEDGTNLIYASSAATYGTSEAPQQIGFENPDNPYGYSKLMMDKLTEKYMRLHNNIKIIGLRYFNVYGQGEFYKDKTASVISQISFQILNKQAPVLFENSKNYLRDFVYIDDVIQANVLAAISEKSGVLNVGSGVARSFQDLSDICQRVFNTNYPNEYIKNNLKSYQTHTEADISKTIETIGYKPKFDLESGIQDYSTHLKKLHIKYKNNP